MGTRLLSKMESGAEVVGAGLAYLGATPWVGHLVNVPVHLLGGLVEGYRKKVADLAKRDIATKGPDPGRTAFWAVRMMSSKMLDRIEEEVAKGGKAP